MINDSKLKDLLQTLESLSLDGETFEICLAALRLQTELKQFYTKYSAVESMT